MEKLVLEYKEKRCNNKLQKQEKMSKILTIERVNSMADVVRTFLHQVSPGANDFTSSVFISTKNLKNNRF